MIPGLDLLMLNCGNGAVKMNNHHKTASLKQTASAPSGGNGDSDRIAKLETEVAVTLTKFEQMPTKDDLHSELDKVKAEIKCTKDDLHSELDKVKVMINENFIHGNDNLHTELDKAKTEINKNFIRVNDNLHLEINKLGETIDKKLWKHTGFLFFSISLVVSVLGFFLKS